jgi:predicted short-subunit dehydrogenase-like oxidoreductase (DUF2520 family)
LIDRGAPGPVWIVGPGRLGLSLGAALHRAGHAVAFSGRSPAIPDHSLFSGAWPAARWLGDSLVPPSPLAAIIVAVPDREIHGVADRLASAGLDAGVPVLHTSGVLDVQALAPLVAAGHPVGSVHPLAAVADPADGVERLRGAWFGVEGQGAAREVAERVVAACGGRVLAIRPGGKAEYHAAAVFASNYAVALLSVAERLMARAGVPGDDARPALVALAEGAVANVGRLGPADALTGPVARGDDATLRLHRARLSGGEVPLYCLLGREALALAERAGLDADAVERVRVALQDED